MPPFLIIRAPSSGGNKSPSLKSLRVFTDRIAGYMKVREIDHFRAPSRKPWLLLVILGVMALIVLYRHWSNTRPMRPSPVSSFSAEKPVVSEKAVVTEPVIAGRGRTRKREAVAMKDGEGRALLNAAKSRESAGDLIGARAGYLDILRRDKNAEIAAETQNLLGNVNIRLALTPAPMAEKAEYVIQSGDFIQKIAREFGVTTDLIEQSNGIKDPDVIKIGDRLRILKGKFAVGVSTVRNELVVYMNGEFFKRYAVGTGKYDKTPKGTFVVTQKEKEPPWWQPNGKVVPFGDEANILGTRWMTLRATGSTPDVRGYGIHGTWDESTIGKSESAGCIRMKNRDVEELYVLLPPGTPVTIGE